MTLAGSPDGKTLLQARGGRDQSWARAAVHARRE
jgi:hypothetical protein